MCTECGNLIPDFGPNCEGCLPSAPIRVLPDACYDCHISELACTAHWAVEQAPCCEGCSHG
jgi:hypothetical protein